MALSPVLSTNKFKTWRERTNEIIERLNSLGSSDDVLITGGTINGAIIGGSNPAAGTFSQLTLSQPLPVSSGGTGETTTSDAINALLPVQTGNSGKVLSTNGSVASWETFSVSAGDISGTIGIANGGTGATNATDARTNLGLTIGTNILAYDPLLQAIANLNLEDSNGSDNKFIYFLGLDSNGVPIPRSDIVTTLARDILSKETETEILNTILPSQVAQSGKILTTDGTNVSWETAALADILSSIANLNLSDSNGSDNKFIYFLGTDSNGIPIARSDIVTSFARGLLNDPNASTMRTTLGLGSIATFAIDNITSPLVVAVNSSSPGIRITQLGSGNALTVEDETNPDSTPVIIDANGRLILNDTQWRSWWYADSHTGNRAWAVSNAGNNAGGYSSLNYGNNSAGPVDLKIKSRGATAGTRGIVADGDTLGGVAFAGDDANAAAPIIAARIAAIVDGTPSTSSMPGRLSFYTTPAGSQTYAEALRIANDKKVTAFGTLVATGLLEINGLSTGAGAIRIKEDTDNGTNYVEIKAPATLSGDVSLVLPSSDGDANQALISDGSGNLSWYDVQPLDAELSALAGLVSAADSLPYFTGVGTAALTTLTSFGRGLIDDADASAARTTLELVIGTHVQAYSTILAAIAGLTSGADLLPYFTGSGTAGTTTLSSFGRGLIDDADAETARATLGLTIGTHVQAYDAELTALASVTSSADTFPYFTGSGTATTTGLTLFARGLLDDPDAATARNTLGLVPGSEYYITPPGLNILDSNLEVNNKIVYYNGVDSNLSPIPYVTTLSPFMRTILDEVDADAVKTALGIASADIGATLQSIKDLTLADSNGSDDKFIYFLGVDSNGNPIARSDIVTQFARSLLNDPDAAAMRTTLGLVIGTNVQAYDTELAALATVTSGADALPYFTGVGTATTTTLTSFARTLLDDASGEIARATLGLRIGTDVQAQDELLQAIANLNLVDSNGTDDKFIYFLGLDSNGSPIARSDIVTSFARTLLNDASAADARSTLGLVIGTNVQAYDAELAALAGLTSAADALPYFTGVGSASTTTLTSFARTLLDDVDASTMRTTLGLVIGTNVQAYDAELAALAGLTSAADALPYFTGVGTATTTTFTSFARTLLDDVDASTMRTTLGLVIGTNVQAYDAELAALAGLTSAADRLPYFTGSGTAALATFTSTARDLLDDSSTSAMRTTLGLGTAATASTGTSDGNVPVYTSGGINMEDKTLQRPILLDVGEKEQTVAAAATTSIDITSGNVVKLTQDTNITTFNFNNPTASGNLCSLLIVRVKDNSATTRSIVWPTAVKWAGGTAPTLTQTANAVDRFIFTTSDGGTTWYGDALGAAYA